VFAQNDPAGQSQLQHLLNDRDAALNALPIKNRYPAPPDVQKKMEDAMRGLVPTERYAQQVEKDINGELKASSRKK
jgi:hypothetical protein